jgi:ATP-binding cassette subfamily B protein
MKKPKRKTYNIFQNCAFMIRRAWRDCKSVLVVALGIILCGVAANLLELFVVPAILEAVERGVSPGALAGMILWFTVGMALVRALRGYLDTNAMFDRIQVRSTLCLDLHMTFCRTSFPHIEDPDYLKRTEEAEKCVTDNNGGGEYVWTTLTELLTNVICFIVYLLLLAQV